jgi:hypothetical protein
MKRTDGERESFSFDGLVEVFRSAISKFPDKRTGNNKRYSMEDAALGAFSIFFTQSPSFLAFQKTMQQAKGESNAQSLFMMHRIPSNNHIRDLLDEVSPSHVSPVFDFIVDRISKIGYLDQFRSINNDLLVPLDGTTYFTSKKICCEKCSTKTHKNGTVTYSHSAITPVIVAPGKNKVLSLPPEFITPQDGHKKQDCENTAAKRWIHEYGARLKAFGVTILGDDLYCHQPLCICILNEGLNFLLVCKPDSHKILYEWLKELENMGEIQTLVVKRWTGKRKEIDTYRFVNQVPLRDGEDALPINWCELVSTLEDGEIIYKNAFATNHNITPENVKEVVAAGRARWKIENENNNTLKTKGYHLEHNFGHGKTHLSSLFLTFNLLAFLFHTVLDIWDGKYKLIRENLPTRKTFFDDIRALTRYIFFKDWNAMMDFMILGLKLDPPDT